MNSKEEIILHEIIKYTKENHFMPTRRYLQRKLGFKSVNSISQYIKSLEQQNYLIRNSENKLILDESGIYFQQQLKKIRIINRDNVFIQIHLNKKKNYLAYKTNNDFLNKYGIKKKDLLIIDIKKRLNSGDIGLFIIDNKYRVMKYDYKDGFYILKDYEELLLSRIKIIGKVIMIERKL